MDQINDFEKNDDLMSMRYKSIERTNEILQERIRVLKITIQAKEEIIDLQEYMITILERELNELQSNHVNEKEN